MRWCSLQTSELPPDLLRSMVGSMSGFQSLYLVYTHIGQEPNSRHVRFAGLSKWRNEEHSLRKGPCSSLEMCLLTHEGLQDEVTLTPYAISQCHTHLGPSSCPHESNVGDMLRLLPLGDECC